MPEHAAGPFRRQSNESTRPGADYELRLSMRIIPNVAAGGIRWEADDDEKKATRWIRMALDCQLIVVNRQLRRWAFKI